MAPSPDKPTPITKPRCSAAEMISKDRLWQRHMQMAQIGATAGGGVNRQALTTPEIEARALLVEWAQAAGLQASLDAIGNMFFRGAGTYEDAAPVMTGSHLDSEPTGGRFDGVFGVLAGLEAMLAIGEAGVVTRRPVELAVWTNEEGCRFEPGCMGSAAYCRPELTTSYLATVDAEGVSLGADLDRVFRRFPSLERRLMGAAPAAFVEAHIEQGPILEAAGATIGVVTGIQGMCRYAVTVEGQSAHGGTTPRSGRKDALLAAVDIVQALRQRATDVEDLARFTVGRCNVLPNSPSVVPSQVTLTMDFRHGDQELLSSFAAAVPTVCQANAGPCEVSVSEISLVPPTVFPDAIQRSIRDAAERCSLTHLTLPSGASHDARNLARLAPSGMIFVPCLKGISHHEAESAEPDDLLAGTRVLAEVLIDLANN